MNKVYPKQYEIWIADLNPSTGSEPGKIRPVVIIQSDLLNKTGHSSTIACSISSQHKEGVSFIRIAVEPTNDNGLLKKSYILCDQVRAIDLQRLKGRLGTLNQEAINQLNETLKAILSL
ncbi:MAG: transcriptional modulator of MazE/toxin, MazF [Mucilaginibacter sp.]|nr:transcriptional modulator of MazE/toxin, MazF [Mucilaginibacter sp.]